MLFIERSGLNFLFYMGKSVTCLVTKNSSYRIPPWNFSLSLFRETYDIISFTSVTISRKVLVGCVEEDAEDRECAMD